MNMFCFQCQEAAGGVGCTVRGVCGKDPGLAKLQDLLVYAVKGTANVVEAGVPRDKLTNELHRMITDSLFMTITNANFDHEAIARQIRAVLQARDELRRHVSGQDLHDAALFTVSSREEMEQKGELVGVLATPDPDIRSLRELITYGLKGMAAYLHHAAALGYEEEEIYLFIYKALDAVLNDSLTVDELTSLALETGGMGVRAMALLDKANTSTYGHPEISQVDIGVRNNPGILISGHDLKDLEQLLEQTAGTGVDVYTHGEMLPAHYYPAFKRYSHFAGNYGNAWWQQTKEFESFRGPIIFTTNCIVPPRSEEVKNRIFTTGAAGFPGCRHIEADASGRKDFSEVIELAKQCPPPLELESGTIIGGFAHAQVFALADQIVEAVKNGSIKKFFVMAGCDGRMPSRSYYTEFATALPEDTVILTAGCAKYRYNKLPLGEIGGIPRVLDAGQCNDSYSLALIALQLKEIFGLQDINELPIEYNLAWYEQKAVIVLLALLHLGVKNIHLGPTLPAFLSPNVGKVLQEQFGLQGIGTVEDDLELFLGSK